MSLRFLDDINAGLPEEQDKPCELGIVLFGADGDWHAVRHHDGVQISGPGSLKTIPKGFWISNSTFEAQRARQDEMVGRLLRADGWMRMPVAEIRSAWGVSQHADQIAARLLAGSCARTYRLVQEALRSAGVTAKRTAFEDQRKLERASSLAMGINAVQGARLTGLIPADEKLKDHFAKAFKSGMYVGSAKAERDENAVRLIFHFPPVTYAKNLTTDPIPRPGTWRMAVRESGASNDSFLQAVAQLDQPTLFRATWDPDPATMPDHLIAFAGDTRSTGAFRSHWVPEELAVMMRLAPMTVVGVLVGESFQDSVTGRLIAALEAVSGGPLGARLSWSAGLAAQNILAASFRSQKGDDRCPSSEAIWLAARDRVAMFPAVNRLCQAGGRLVSAQSGTIMVDAPDDPELIMILCQEAWEAGLHMTIGQIDMLQERGVPPPTEPSLFGGSEIDCALALAIHGKKRNAMWRMDSLIDLPQADREAAFRAVLHG